MVISAPSIAAAHLGATAIKSLNVRSMGEYGVATQIAGTLESDIKGGLGALHVTGDVDGEYLNVGGSIGPVTIGGSPIGGSVTNSGAILSGGSIGLVKIGGDLRGGSGFQSGAIIAAGQTQGITLAGVTIGGSLLGGDGVGSGEVLTSGGGGDPGNGRSGAGHRGTAMWRVAKGCSIGPRRLESQRRERLDPRLAPRRRRTVFRNGL